MTEAAAAPAPAAPANNTPFLGLLAVLLGTFISTLNGRLSSFGLNDIRGAIHAGFDEGAWITTAQTVAQMLVAPFAVWAGSIFGPRRVLMVGCGVFMVASLLLPLSPNLAVLLVLQFIAGLGSGTFIPLTLGFILRGLAPKFWAYGVALYALNLELSLNISASLEGWYDDNFSWRWIFWQNVPLALGMLLCLHYGVRRLPPPQRLNADVFGLTSCGVGLALIYAALDQGNRLDWLNSGLVCGLLLAGILLLAAFVFHELTTPEPWLNLHYAFAMPLPLLLLLVAFLRLTIQSTAFLIPQYLGGVRGFRALEVGQTLFWIAAPQLVLCPFSAFMLRRADPRVGATIGMVCVSIACLMVAYNLTPSWGSDEFLPSQLLQAVGQSLALSGIVFLGILNLRPDQALTFGAMLQTARLMGGELGTALISTAARVREQHASNLIGQHVQAGAADVLQRLAIYGRVAARGGHPGAGTAILGRVVRVAATTQSVIDAFMLVAFAVVGALLLLVVIKPPPRGPASHIPLFARSRGSG